MTTAVRYGLALAALALCGCTAHPAAVEASPTSTPNAPGTPSSAAVPTRQPAPSRSAAASPAFPTRTPVGGVHTSAAAQQLADALVAAVEVPPGAVLQSTPPPSSLPPGMTTGVETKVEVTRWYTVVGTRDAALDWLAAHGPGGFRFFESMTVSGPGPAASYARFLELGSDTPSQQPPGHVQASALQDGDHADVRISVEVVWTALKTAIEIIPASVSTGILNYQRPAADGRPTLDKKIRLTPAQVDRLRRSLNPTKPVAPGESSCPESPDSATLTLAYGGHHVAFNIQTGGCDFIVVSVDGVPQQPYMSGGYALGGPIRVMAGLPAKVP